MSSKWRPKDCVNWLNEYKSQFTRKNYAVCVQMSKNLLGLEAPQDLNEQQLHKTRHMMMLQMHPDKGGSAECIYALDQALLMAYKTLQSVFKSDVPNGAPAVITERPIRIRKSRNKSLKENKVGKPNNKLRSISGWPRLKQGD